MESNQGLFVKVWKDPVGSKVISVGIVAAIAATWAFATNHLTDIFNLGLSALTFKIPAYIFLVVIAVYFVGKKLFKPAKPQPQPKHNPLWDVEIGNYTFKELYEILLQKKVEPYDNIKVIPVPDFIDTIKFNLVTLFSYYANYLGNGIGKGDPLNDNGFAFDVVLPMLLPYGLVEKKTVPHPSNAQKSPILAFTYTPLGLKFIAQLEKILNVIPAEKQRLLNANVRYFTELARQEEQEKKRGR